MINTRILKIKLASHIPTFKIMAFFQDRVIFCIIVSKSHPSF